MVWARQSGIKSCWSQDFACHSRRPWGPPNLLYNGFWGSFSEEKQPGLGIDDPPPSSTEVKERVKLYLYSTSEPSQPVLG